MTEKRRVRIPGMAWIVIAFAPWVVYWILASQGQTTAAIVVGLSISLAINGYRVAVHKIKILDAVSLFFLAISALVTLVLRSDLLVFYGGMLSDVTLALVAWGSLLARNPFTYDYAKEDWDKAYWNNPIFIETNQIITAVWGVIFTVQALSGGMALAFGLEGAPRLMLVAILPRALLFVAIGFSAWFPKWYPPRAAARQNKPRTTGRPSGLTGLQLIETMPLAFNAQAAGDLQATIQFCLSGDDGGTGYLKIGSGQCAFQRGQADQPTLTIESTALVWTAISRGEMSGAEAFLKGAYRATGDLSVLMQLGTLFQGSH